MAKSLKALFPEINASYLKTLEEDEDAHPGERPAARKPKRPAPAKKTLPKRDK